MASHNQSCSDAEFVELIKIHGPTKTAKILGISLRNVFTRRRSLEKIYDTEIKSADHPLSTRRASEYPIRLEYELKNGIILIGSDAHYWPGIISTAHRGLIHLSKELKPKAVILNGDVVDGASISRHPPIGWASTPTPKEELQTCDERMDEIRAAANGASLLWTLGNHDMRFESKLAQEAQAFRGIKGFSLSEHFPHWKMCWSVWFNNYLVIKHRFKGGIHATHNNTVMSGKSIATGHLHSLKVTPFSDYNGIRYGIDTGTLADPCGDQFTYDEDNPKNHRSGFIVLTFKDGLLLWPEIAAVVSDGLIQFRGQVIKV